MTRRIARAGRAFAIAVALSAAIVGPAAADNDSCPGTIDSASLRTVPPGASFDVENYGNPDNPLTLRTKFLKWLTRAGYKAAANPQYMFSFKATVSRQSSRSYSGKREEDALASGPRDTLTTQYETDFAYGGLQKFIVPGGGGGGGGYRLHLNVQLRDQSNGRVVWFADIYCEPLTDDRAELIQVISQPIIANLNRTSRQQSF